MKKKKKIGIQFRKITSLPGYPAISLIIFVSFKRPQGILITSMTEVLKA